MRRQITRDAVNAFLLFEPFKRGNTEVKVERIGSHFRVELYLHGKMIASRQSNRNYISIRDAGWPTVTTKERLNGLPNVDIYQKNSVWFLNDRRWDGSLVNVPLNTYRHG